MNLINSCPLIELMPAYGRKRSSWSEFINYHNKMDDIKTVARSGSSVGKVSVKSSWISRNGERHDAPISTLLNSPRAYGYPYFFAFAVIYAARNLAIASFYIKTPLLTTLVASQYSECVF